MTGESLGQKRIVARDLVTGIAAAAFGVLAVAIAALEYYVSVEMIGPRAQGAAAGVFGMTPGTEAYVLCYLAAGAILMALGVWKICRSRRGT